MNIKSQPFAHTDHPVMPLHWVYYMLYELGLLSGLWLHGDPHLTLVLMLAALPLGFIAYIPHRYFSDDLRHLCHYLMASASVAWVVYRLSQKPALDLALIEMFSIMGLSFAFTTHRRGYYFMLVTSIILLLYGAVIPARSMYVYMLPLGLGVCLLLAYQTRVASICNEPELETRGTFSWRSTPWIGVHLVLILILWGFLVVIFPTPGISSYGLAPSSMQNRNVSLLPPKFNQWLQSRYHTPGRDGQFMMDGQDPISISPNAKTRVQSNGWPPSMDNNGSGGGPPGKDLVMRVQSPVKMYWLGRLYDHYNGQSWNQTRALLSTRIDWSDLSLRQAKTVRQTFVIEKWVTYTLFSGYMRHGSVSARFGHDLSIRNTFGGTWIHRPKKMALQLPVPFTYEVHSIIDYKLSDDEENPYPETEGWYEPRPPEDYLQLPDNLISDRTRSLVIRLTDHIDDPLQKAYALRDYLRQNFTYSLTGDAIPNGVEPVDFFLFQRKQGHCEYYASSLAVMARLAGLPARVATGFSPGDYNVLSNMFEVYEYHAHAWTQIFVPGYGWLTMDGTPPGSLPNESRTTPAMIGDLRDPFSEEWRIKTPELSKDTQDLIRQQTTTFSTRMARSEMSEKNQSSLQKAMETLFGKTSNTDNDLSQAPDNPVAAFQQNFGLTLKNFAEHIRSARDWLLQNVKIWHILLPVALYFVVHRYLPRIRAYIRKRRRMRRYLRYFERARLSLENDPQACIMHAYRAIRGFLELAGFHKENRQDLMEYNQTLKPSFGDSANRLFSIYTQFRYQPKPPTVDDVRAAFAEANLLREQLLEMISAGAKKDL